MMFVNVLIAILSIVGSNQKSTVLKITYQEYLDINSPIPLDREAQLVATMDESLYYSARSEEHGLRGMDWKGNIIEGTQVTSSSKSTDIVEGELLFRTYRVDPYGNCVYISKEHDLMKVRTLNSLTLLYDEDIPEISWKIEKDSTKVIGNYLCIRATANFRGRKYVSWFTPEIPLSSGPWKLNGLPGLILEAYDVKGKIKFSAKRIEYSDENIGFSSDLERWTGKRCSFDESKTLDLETSIKEWIKQASLNFNSRTTIELRYNLDLNNFLEIYPEEQAKIVKKYKRHLIVK